MFHGELISIFPKDFPASETIDILGITQHFLPRVFFFEKGRKDEMRKLFSSQKRKENFEDILQIWKGKAFPGKCFQFWPSFVNCPLLLTFPFLIRRTVTPVLPLFHYQISLNLYHYCSKPPQPDIIVPTKNPIVPWSSSLPALL